MTVSKIYFGKVGHTRYFPKHHALKYHVAYLYLDLDEIDDLAKHIPFFARNKAGIFSFHDKDHGDGTGGDIKAWALDALLKNGFSFENPKIFILTMPRMFGYGFNPISVYYCFENKDLKTIIYEVNNTFKERVAYVLPVENEGLIRQTCKKTLFVSPFFEVKGYYTFATRKPADKLALSIGYFEDNRRALTAWVAGKGETLTTKSLGRFLAQMPFLTFKVILGIHWEALKLFFKGLRPKFRPRFKDNIRKLKPRVKKV